jgi:hypothetical protein
MVCLPPPGESWWRPSWIYLMALILLSVIVAIAGFLALS